MWGALLDTKGPEIRTAMLREGKNIQLEKGQPIIVEAVGDAYTTFEGFKDETETRIGLSYSKLCTSVSPGDRILISDGTISIRVTEILSATTLAGEVLNSKELGQRKNCNLPGVKVDLPVLTDKDVLDLKEFGCKHKVDFVAASFVQSAADVKFIRKVLDEAGGTEIKIISKIENQEGLNNFDEILLVTDGIMVARGDLGANILLCWTTLFALLHILTSCLCVSRHAPWCTMRFRHGDSVIQGASGTKDDDLQVQPPRQVCHLCHPDARVHDLEPASHAGRND